MGFFIAKKCDIDRGNNISELSWLDIRIVFGVDK